jgi:hypothetical protein
LAWRHTNATIIATGKRKKRLLVLQWIDEEQVDAEQLRVWEDEVQRRPYIGCGFSNAGLDHQELKIAQEGLKLSQQSPQSMEAGGLNGVPTAKP